MRTKQLMTAAIDNHRYAYVVTLVEEYRLGHDKTDWLLCINGTPGSWFMSTLENHSAALPTISILRSENWECVNFDAVMTEAVKALEGIDRVTAAESNTFNDSFSANIVSMRGR